MNSFRRLLCILLCLVIVITGRGPVTEMATTARHDHARSTASNLAHHAQVPHAGTPGHLHESSANHEDPPAQGHDDADEDSCACGCGMGSCAALPADLLMHHPQFAPIALRIDLPMPRSAGHTPAPMAPLLRPPIG